MFISQVFHQVFEETNSKDWGENTEKTGQKNPTAYYYFIVGSKLHNNFKIENSIGILTLLQ